MKFDELNELLDSLYLRYKKKFSSKDPVWILHRFQDECDIEIIGLITSAYSYGQVDQINRFIERLLAKIGSKPYEFTINFQKRKDKKFLKRLSYRFNTENDLINLFSSINANLMKYSSLKNLFISSYKNDAVNIVEALTNFSSSHNLKQRNNTNRYYHYLVANPANKSTCKRMNLFLRWMVRKDEIDLGIWNDVSASKLIMPVDTHIARISKRLKLVKRKTIDLKFAIELTEKLKKFDINDPVKYDFALCHIGIDKRLQIAD
jgi:uncharacterized protein (TIGR02757 family)